MKRKTVIAIVIATITSVGTAGLSSPSAFAQQEKAMGPGMGMGHGMMGSGKGDGMMGNGKMGGGGMMGMMGGRCHMMGDGGQMPMHREGRIAFIKAELAISDAQTKVWDAYAAALKKNMQNMHDMRKSMMAARTGKTPVERLDARIAGMEGRLEALKDIKPALVALYDSLSDDQKKKADQILTGMGCMM